MSYKGTVDLVAGLRRKNNANFTIVDSKDVYVEDSYKQEVEGENVETTLDNRVLSTLEYNDETNQLTAININGEPIGDPVTIVGGGGGAYGYNVRIVNGLPSTLLTVASTQTTILPFTYIETYGDELQNQNGLLTVQYKLSTTSGWVSYITNQQIPCNVQQNLNVTNLLSVGQTTNIRIVCSNGRSGDDAVTKTLQYDVTCVEMSIETSFNSNATYTGNFSLPYTCIGRGLSKTVYLYIDGLEYTHINVGTSNGQLLQLPVELVGNYSYGSHIARLWFETDTGALSNILVFPILYDNGQSDEPIIGATLVDDEIENGETLNLKYVCYTPSQETTDSLTIRVYSEDDGEETDYYSATFSNITNNTEFILPISQYPELGTGYVVLTSGASSFTLSFTVTEIQSDYDLTSVTTGLVYSYRPTGYTNNSAGKDNYVYGLVDAAGNNRNIYTRMTGFNWVTDGYLDGESLTIAGAARMNIDLPILTTSFMNADNQRVVLDAASGATVTTSGRTIEFEFELDNVTNQNSVVFSCLDDNGVGFVITPQVCYILSDGQSPVFDSTGFIENEESIPCAYIKDEKRIRVTFVVQKKTYTNDGRFTSYANIFINGEYANSYLYSEDAIYNGSATVTIGSADCVTHLYDVRMYNRDLTKYEVLRNHMNSDIDIRNRIAQNEYNDILNDNGDVDYNKARYKYPCLLFIGKLSNFKNDRQYVGVVLTKPDGLGSYTTEFSLLDKDDVGKFVSSIKVQGTSSQRFMRKNFKVYLVKNKDSGGTSKVKYVLKGYDDNDQPLSIGESTLCFKMDYMSTDHANTFNANIADTLFNDKPAGSLVQNCVWGFRCLLFNMAAEDYTEGVAFENYPEGVIEFAGDGCLNNDKGNTKTFGLETDGDDGTDTLMQKWEFKDNSNPLCTFKTDRLMEKIYTVDTTTGVTSWKRQARNGLESCYPDEGDLDDAGIEPKYDHIQLLYTWLYQRANFWDASTASGTGGTYNGAQYSTERELKKAIFKREFPMHFNMEHALVYYIFIEWVALCDNRAKNMFLSCKDITVEHIAYKTSGITSIWDIVNDETGEVDESKIDWDNSTFGIWYCDLYDLDSCFGAENSGYIRIPYYADWNYQLGRTGTYQFNGHDSRLWCMFEEDFADEIKARAQVITRSNTGYGALNYAVLKQVHITDNAELVCPAVVNNDMEYKYEDAWTKGYYDYSVDPENPTWTQTSAYKYLQRGSRTEQKESFIYRRSMMLYSKYQCDQFTNDRLAFRCGTAVAQNDTTLTLSAIQSLYLGAQYGDSGSPVMTNKKNAGETGTITAPNALGRSDNVYIMGASNLTSVSSLAAFHPYEIGLTNAGKLKTLLIGSNASGYSNGDLSALDTSACTLLDTLNVQGCTGFTDTPISLGANTLIREVYAGGSTVPYFTFANGGILETLELGTPKRIIVLNQPYMTNFSYDSLNELVMLRIEGTPNMNPLDIIKARLANLRLGLRLVNINETITGNDFEVFKMLTSDVAKGKMLDANGNLSDDPDAYPVITGTINCDVIGTETYAQMRRLYPDLTINYAQSINQFTVTFVNYDGAQLGTQLVDAGGQITDPVLSGEMSTPTRAMDSHYIYTYSGWDNITSLVYSDRTVTAQYTTTVRTYTVSWYDGIGTGNGSLLEQKTGISYGTQTRPTVELPTYTGLESSGIYYVFKGWDASTGYISGDTIVHATWDVAYGLPPRIGEANRRAMQEMSAAEIYAVTRDNEHTAEQYWNPKEYVDITLGRDYNYSNVESKVLISQPTFFDGATTIIFNGATEDTPLIQLFKEDAESFTLAIDYEFINDSGCLASCFDNDGSEGFMLMRSGNYTNVRWGNNSSNVGYQYQRSMLVLRHVKGSRLLYAYYDGNTSANVYPNNQTASNVSVASLTREIETSTTAPLTFGGVGYLNGSDAAALRGKGWIHWAKIWYDDIGAYDATAMATFPHFNIRFNCSPSVRYTLASDLNSTASAMLMAETPLPLVKQMNSTNTNAGGWDSSHMRIWINGQFLNALPLVWQSIIKEVRVSSSKGQQSTETQTSFDKVYLATYYEVTPDQASSHTNQTYLAEMDLGRNMVPYFVVNRDIGMTSANNSRIKFPGFTIPNDANYLVLSGSDPTAYEGLYSVYPGKTIWIKSDNSSIGYIYVDADFLSKHRHACGRVIGDADNDLVIDAFGADSNGNTGGKWLRSAGWWLRSPYLSSSTSFWLVYTGGGLSNYFYAALSSSGVVPAFSI